MARSGSCMVAIPPLAVGVVFVVGASTPLAHAIGTAVVFEASTDLGATWHSLVNAEPGDSVRIRLRVSLYNNSGPGAIPAGGGLGGLNLKPTLDHWLIGRDEVVPFGEESLAENEQYYIAEGPSSVGPLFGPGVRPPGINGRQAPFAANGTNTGSVPRPLYETAVNNPYSVMFLDAPGTGPNAVSMVQYPPAASLVNGWNGRTWTDGSTTYENPTQQQIDDLGLTQDTFAAGSFFNRQKTNVVVFQYTLTLDAVASQARSLTQSASDIQASWWTGSSFTTTVAAEHSVTNATINVVPTPGVACLVVVGTVFAARRRR